MAIGALLAVSVTAASLLLSTFWHGAQDFVPGACDRIETHLHSEIVGQHLALQQVSDAVCDHLKQTDPQKPLVLSAHGPPGVGKTLMHLLLARSLYSKTPEKAVDCPGHSCPSYKVLYGLDYTVSDQAVQHELLKASILDHLHYNPESLLVIEEYDKLDCRSRGLLRQLIDSSRSANVSASRSIIIMESNTGFLELHKLLADRPMAHEITAEETQKILKDLVFDTWSKSGCESDVDILKLLSLIDFYLPFFPLERRHIWMLFEMKLKERQEELTQASKLLLKWDNEVVEFLVSKVDFNGPFPIEGAKEVKPLMTRYVTRALREWILHARKGRDEADKLASRIDVPRALMLQLAPHAAGLIVQEIQ